MLLTISITNTLVRAGIAEGDSLRGIVSLGLFRTADEYAALLEGAYRIAGIDLSRCCGAIIGSVVPQLNPVVAGAVRRLTGHTAQIVGAGVRTGIDIRVEQHTQLGADIVANAAASLRLTQPPLVAVDFGAATTFSIVNRSRELCGVIIAAGLRLSVDALSANAAFLPDIELSLPRAVIGKNTADSMSSGALYGHAGMADSLLTRVSKELREDKINVILTGEHANLLDPLIETPHILLPDLTLLGLSAIYQADLAKRSRQPV